MGRIIFLLEEPSMKILLDGLLPRLFPGWIEGQHFQCVPHEGKSDLDRSIPRKLKAWREHGVKFVIVRDNDCAESIGLKARLRLLCTDSGREETLVRLVCQELESWYIGDLQALSLAFADPKLNSSSMRKKFSIPDEWQKPSVELSRLIPSFQKGSGARSMAKFLSESANLSHSFQIFVFGVRRLAKSMGYEQSVT